MTREELKRLRAEVLDATDIVSVVGDYMALQRAGRGFKGLCPFHDEKTPSFHVSPERQTWHCFGRCSRGGNAIDFLIEKEGLEFWQALGLLAGRAGIHVPDRPGGPEAGSAAAAERAASLRANEAAERFFRRALVESREAEQVRAYLDRRGVDNEWQERFGLGYAPRDGRHLRRALERRGVGPADAAAAGLVGEREGGGYFDRFRERLMFPIRDVLGRVVGFGGRALAEGQMPKYKNTPETGLFRKRELCYGLYESKETARERGEVAIVEGYFDVILCHQAGFPFAVATLGTAFGAEHARQLRRIAGRVTVFFDGDAAGRQANLRGLKELCAVVFEGARPFETLRVAELPEGLDPADLVVERGAEALAQAIAQARSLVDFIVPADEARTWPPERKVEAVEVAAGMLAAFDHATYREVQLAEVAHRLGVSEALVRERAAAARRDAAARVATREERAERDEAAGGGAGAGRAKAEVGAGGRMGDAAEVRRARVRGRGARLTRLERWALRCLVAVPELAAEAAAERVHEALPDPRAREVAAAIEDNLPLREIASEEARRLAAQLEAEVANDPDLDYAKEWEGVLRSVRERRAQEQAPRTNDEASLRAFLETQRRLKAGRP